ncbi:MAG: hypothetical protein HY951_12820 [Bacteroidia bacterium]|nr:hypothetical protein [Bacteroidia bacterium]
MEDHNIHNKINELLGQTPDKFQIIEENIPIDIQVEYFDYSKRVREESDYENVMIVKDLLFNPLTVLPLKKEILSKLAFIDKPEAYRTIEKYLLNPDNDLEYWAKLALLENKMLLESSILEQNHILISSGLGGKNNKLRYFLVVFLKEGFLFDEMRKKVVLNEFDVVLKKNHCNTEQLKFYKYFFTLTVLVPLDVSLKNAFVTAIDECNQFGGFLMDNYIVTNVKKLNAKEIKDFISRQSKENK